MGDEVKAPQQGEAPTPPEPTRPNPMMTEKRGATAESNRHRR